MFSKFSFIVLGLAGLAGLGLRSVAVATTLAEAAITTQVAGPELARSNNCLGCHQIDKKRVGPPFMAISERFAPIEGAHDFLAEVIRSGSRGRWGAIPMPAQTQVSPEDARLLADWIMSLARPEAQAQDAGQAASRN